VLAHVIAYWESAPKHRNPVYARDGWRCAAPGCSSRRNLHDHHIVFKSQLGGNERDNRITVCAWHHLRGIHAGTFKVAGRVSKGLVWEVGVRAGRPPLMRCAGDAYIDAVDLSHLNVDEVKYVRDVSDENTDQPATHGGIAGLAAVA
jgi:hypothetical protein